METHKRVEEWAKRMGYKGKIPDCLKNICGPSTAHIWEQLITNVKPKEEIEHIRNNIIVHKLREGKEKCDGVSSREKPIKEIQSYKKREQLKLEIAGLEDDIAEKSEELESVERKIGSKNVALENLRDEIRETKRKTFLYRKKSEQLERDISDVQEKLDFVASVTPTEGEKDDQEISDTLRKCAEKIKCAIENNDGNSFGRNVEETACGNATVTAETVFSCDYNKLLVSTLPPRAIDGLGGEEFSEDIKTILRGNNFKVNSGVFSKLTQECKMKLANAVSEKDFSIRQDCDNTEVLSEIYANDIENNLLVIKYEREISTLNEELDDMKKKIFIKLGSMNLSSNQVDALREIFLLQLKEAGLSATVSEVEKMLSAATDDDSVMQQLDNAQSKCVEEQKKLQAIVRKINSMQSLYKHVYRSIGLCQSESRQFLERFRLITGDLVWLTPLTQNLNAKEVWVFGQFDLGYNRAANLNGNKVFVRNVLRDTLNISNVDQSCLQIIRTLTSRMDATPEEVFFHLLQVKRRLNAYQISTPTNAVKCKRHSIDDFERREVCVNNLLVLLEGTLKEYVRSTSKHSPFCMEKAMSFWLGMPIREFVSPQRMFDGQNFNYYQKIYDNVFDKL